MALIVMGGCHCSHVREAGTDAAPDTAREVTVMGCEDPAVWSTALRSVELWAEIGGGPCSRAQYPAHIVVLGWGDATAEERAAVQRSCWRVVEADEASGWSRGEIFASETAYARVVLAGFDRPVTFEGRLIRGDGTLALAIEPGTVALDPLVTTASSVGDLVAVMGTEAWASAAAVHLWGESVATDEVIGGASGLGGDPVTLHRSAEGLTLRFWSHVPDGAVSSRDLALGHGERAALARGGGAVAIDDDLLIIGSDAGEPSVRHRVTLPDHPLEVIGRYYYVIAHVPGALWVVDRTTGSASALSVDDGKLLATDGDGALVFFDGETLVPVHRMAGGPWAFDESWRVRPNRAHIDALGELLAAPHGIVVGQNGFMAALDAADPTPGPRFSSVSALFGDGAITVTSDDGVSYAVRRADGTVSIHRAPHVDYCD